MSHTLRVRGPDGQVFDVPVSDLDYLPRRFAGRHIVGGDSGRMVVLDDAELAAWRRPFRQQRTEYLRARQRIGRLPPAELEALIRGSDDPWAVGGTSYLDSALEGLGTFGTWLGNKPRESRDYTLDTVRELGTLGRDAIRAGRTELGTAIVETARGGFGLVRDGSDALGDAAGNVGRGWGSFFGNAFSGALGMKPGFLLLIVGGGVLAFYAFTPGGLALIGIGKAVSTGGIGALKTVATTSIKVIPAGLKAAGGLIPGNAVANAAAGAL